MKKPEIRQLLDKEGENRIIAHHFDKTIVIYLKLASETRRRRIGTVTKSTRTLRIWRKRDIHLFRKGNAYGFCDVVIRESKSFDTIWLSDESASWKIPKKFIMDEGSYFNFKQTGFELQRFVSLDQIEPYRKKKKDKQPDCVI